MRSRSLFLGLALAGLSTLGPATAHAERPQSVDTNASRPVEFRYRLDRGTSTAYTLAASQTIEGLQGTIGSSTEVAATVAVRQEVLNIDANGAAELVVSLTSPTGTLTVAGESQPATGITRALEGVRLTRRVTNDGTVTERTGTINDTGSAVDVSEFIGDVLLTHSPQFPAAPIAVGSQWQQNIPLTMSTADGSLNATLGVTYTFSGFVPGAPGRLAVIDAAYSTRIDGVVNMGAGGMRTIEIIGRGDGAGYLIFDVVEGAVREAGLHNGVLLTMSEPNQERVMQSVETSATLTSASAALPGEGTGTGAAATP